MSALVGGLLVATCAADVERVPCPECGGVTEPELDMGGGTDAEWFAWCLSCSVGVFLSELAAEVLAALGHAPPGTAATS